MSTGSNNGGGGGGGGGGPCGACKFLRRKCVPECVFAPYFVSDQGVSHFAAVHKVFGASNVTKLLLHIPVNKRRDAVITICYEAQARLRDPVYGCVAQIVALQQQVANLQGELSYFQAHLATLEPVAPPPPPPQMVVPPAGLSITDLPTATCTPTAYDLSSLFDPTMQPSSWNVMQQMQGGCTQFGGGTTAGPPVNLPPPPQGGGGSGDGSFDEELGGFVAVQPCSSGNR